MGTFINSDLINAVQPMSRRRRAGDPVRQPWDEQSPITRPTDVSQLYPNVNDDQPPSEIQNYSGISAPTPTYPSIQPVPALRQPGAAAVDATATTPGMSAVPAAELPGSPYPGVPAYRPDFPAGPPPQNPDIPRQPNRTDAIYNDKFSRKRGFVEGLMRGLATGNPLAGVIEGSLGAASKRIGGDWAYQHDFNQYANTREAQLKIEDMDPTLRHQMQMDTLKQQMNNLITRGTIQTEQKKELQDNAAGNTQEAIKARGENAVKVAELRGKTQKDIADMRIKAKQQGDLPGLTALYQAKGYDEITSKALATDDLLERNSATIEKLWAQGDQAAATTTLREKQAANVGQGKPPNGLTANKSLDVDLKPIDTELRNLDREESDLKKNRLGMSPTRYNAALADIAKRKTDAQTRRQDVVNQHRGGQATTPGLTPQQDADYKARKAKYPNLTVQQYLAIMSQINK